MEYIFRILGCLIIFGGLIIGSISGVYDNRIFTIYFLSGAVSGIFLIGIGEIIAYLHKIYLHLEPQEQKNKTQ